MDRLRSPRSAAKALARRVQAKALGTDRGLAGLPPEQQLSVLYELLLGRKPDPCRVRRRTSRACATARCRRRSSPSGSTRRASGGRWRPSPSSPRRCTSAGASSSGRCPEPAASSTSGAPRSGSDKGAMVLMGYPYAFDELVVVDLPPDDRNDLYKESVARDVIQTELGPVHYRYHSMSDLARYGDGSFDLVYSGQSIEHVPVDEAERVLVGGGEDPAPRRSPRPRHAQRPGVPGPATGVHRPRPRSRVHPRRDDRQAARRGVRGPRGQGPQPGGALGGRQAPSRSRRWPPTEGSSPTSRTAIS